MNTGNGDAMKPLKTMRTWNWLAVAAAIYVAFVVSCSTWWEADRGFDSGGLARLGVWTLNTTSLFIGLGMSRFTSRRFTPELFVSEITSAGPFGSGNTDYRIDGSDYAAIEENVRRALAGY